MAGFTKRRRDAPPGFFAVEAAGLAWLAQAGGARVVQVLAVGADSITVEQIDAGAPSSGAARDFGAALARTHAAGAAAFGAGPPGWTGDGFIGDAALPLRGGPAWGEFYAQWRVEPYVRTARDTGALDAAGGSVLDRLCGRLAAGDFDDPAPPARIHGDLWSGNLLWSPEGAVLIDPAAHGGHRVTDLAMLALFGAPYLPAIVAGYESASPPLPPGWRDLVALHQVHPLLVHAVLFGGGYGAQAVAAARHYV